MGNFGAWLKKQIPRPSPLEAGPFLQVAPRCATPMDSSLGGELACGSGPQVDRKSMCEAVVITCHPLPLCLTHSLSDYPLISSHHHVCLEDLPFPAEALAEGAGVPLRWCWVSRARIPHLSAVTHSHPRASGASQSLGERQQVEGRAQVDRLDQSSSRVEASPAAQGHAEGRGQALNTVIIRPPPSQPAPEAPVGWWQRSGSHPEPRLLGDPLPASQGGGQNSLPEAVRPRGGPPLASC